MSAPSREELEEAVRLADEARDLEKQARQRRDRLTVLNAKFSAFLDGRDSRRRLGHVITRELVKARVKWRDAFVEVAGVEEADKLVEKAPTNERIKVVPQ